MVFQYIIMLFHIKFQLNSKLYISAILMFKIVLFIC